MASDNMGHTGGGSLPEYFSEILRGKDKMIRVQAKRIEMLEYEVQRLRLVRETLSTQLALAICQLQQQGRLPPDQGLDATLLSGSAESVAFQVNGHLPKSDKSSEALSSQNVAVKHSLAAHHLAGDSTLTRRQEQLANKYGGTARACKAASKIQQTFRQYSLSRNFEKLRQEVENTRNVDGGDRRLRLRRTVKQEDRQTYSDEHPSTSCDGIGDIVDKEFGDIDEDGDQDGMALTFGSKDQLFIAEEASSSRETSPADVNNSSSSNVNGDQNSESTADNNNSKSSSSSSSSKPIIDPSSVNFEKVLEAEDDDDNDSVVVSGSAEDQLRGLKNLEKHLITNEHLGLEKFRLLSLRERFGGSLYSATVPSVINGFPKPFQPYEPLTQPPMTPISTQRQISNDRAAGDYQDHVRRNLLDDYHHHQQQQQHVINMSGDASPVWRRKPNNSWLSGTENNPLFNNNNRSTLHFNGDMKDDYFGSSATSSTADSASLGSGDAVNAAIAASSFDGELTQRDGAIGPQGLTDRQTKRLYRIGLNLFNRKPEKGIQFLMSYRFIENKPRSVARFLLTRKGLSKQMIGSYLGNLMEQFNMDVLDCFANEIDLSGLEIDAALRKFQSHFRMPGEAQKIQRLMESFASSYCECNPNVMSKFQSPDIILLLSYAIIMLNTDLHNNNIKPEKKMDCFAFIKNLKGLDCGRDIDPNMLREIYDRIYTSPLKPANDHVIQVAKVDNMIVGKKPILVQPHRRLVCYCRLFEVFDPLKREKSNQHQREVFLFNDILLVTKQSSKKKNSSAYNYRESFPLAGMTIVLFDLPHCKHGIQLLSRQDNLVLITFCAKNEIELKKFVEDLNEAILEVNEMETLRMQEELSKQSDSDPTLNYASVGSSHYSSTPSIQSRGSGDQIPPYLIAQHQLNGRIQNDPTYNLDLPTPSGLSSSDSRQYLYSQLAGFSGVLSAHPQGSASLNRHSKDSGIVDVDAPAKQFGAVVEDLRSKQLPFPSPNLDRQMHHKMLQQMQQNSYAYFNESILDGCNNRNSSGSLDSGIPSILSGNINSDRSLAYAGTQTYLASSGHPQVVKTNSLAGSMNHAITSSASSLVSSSSSSSSSSKFNLFARKNKACKAEDQ